jgi:putative PIN family toxin of toxin-antitoxin system
MIRVVLDTNIVVSAMLRSGSLPEAVFSLMTNRIVQLYVSEAILAEYQEVLNRPRLRIAANKAATALKRIREIGLVVRPSTPVNACSDPDDNIFIECAQTARADYLVTGNTAHFPEMWGRTRVVTARQFLEAVIDAQLSG